MRRVTLHSRCISSIRAHGTCLLLKGQSSLLSIWLPEKSAICSDRGHSFQSLSIFVPSHFRVIYNDNRNLSHNVLPEHQNNAAEKLHQHQFCPKYTILSHTWSIHPDDPEVEFQPGQPTSNIDSLRRWNLEVIAFGLPSSRS